MARLFVRDASDADRAEWLVLALEDRALRLSPAPPRWLAEEPRQASVEGTAILLFPGDAERRQWVLVAATGCDVRVNGLPLHGGLRILEDRDEIRAGDFGTCFFSAEELPRVEPYVAVEGACMRCKLPLAGRPAVRCPVCGIWHHEDEAQKRLCWSDFDGCASCRSATAMDGRLRWSPEDL